MIESNHKIDTLSRCPRQKVGGLKWWAWTQKTVYAAQNVKIIYKNCGFFQNILRDFLFIQISKTDHFEWSKAIIKLKPFWEAPEKKVGGKKWWTRTHKCFNQFKDNSPYTSNFLKIFWEISYLFKYPKLNILNDRKWSWNWNPFWKPKKKSWGSKMMGTDPQFFLRGQKWENQF